MGNTPSTLSTDTLALLQKFNIFTKFPTDRLKADYIIAVEATNALKHVNTNFLSRLGGHRKRKQAPLLTAFSPNFTTPKRRSRRVTITPLSSNNLISPNHSISSPSKRTTSTYNINEYDTGPISIPTLPIHSSSISYRVLLPHDLFRLEYNSQVVLVVDNDSYGFRKGISQYIDNDVLSNHSREQGGEFKYEFHMTIGAFAIRDSVLNGAINEAEQVLRYNQGDGLTLISTQYNGLKYNVRFKDVFTGKVQLYEKVDSHYAHPDFFAAAGRSQDPRVYGPIYQAFFRMVHGDNEQTLRVLVAYYRQKTESLVCDLREKKLKIETNTVSCCVMHDIHNGIQSELCNKNTLRFAEWVESIYTLCFELHFSSWHDPSSPLVSEEQIKSILQVYKYNFPISASVMSNATNSETNNTLGLQKRYLSLQHFLSMCRQRNVRLLTTWAMVEGLSQVARGLPRVANYASVNRRYALSYPTIFRKLKAMVPSVRYRNRLLLQSEVCLDTGFDNFQLFLKKKFQRDGTSATSIHATCRLAKRSIPVIPSVGSILQVSELTYNVIAILQHSTYCSLLRVVSAQSPYRRQLISWPSMGWTVVSLNGAEPQSKAIDYRNCYVPRTLYMRRFSNVNINYMMFHNIPPPHKPSGVQQTTECISSDYMMVLRRCRITHSLQQAFGYETIEHRKQKKNDGYKNDIGMIDDEVNEDMNQNNVSTMCDIIRNNKVLMKQTKSFQSRYIESWNINVNECSQMMCLDLSKFDEISNDGCIQMLVEMLHDYGLIEKDNERIGHYKLVHNINNRRLRIYGDCLSMEKIRHMESRVYSVVTHPGKAEFVEVILTALKQCQQGIGDLHVAMHMMVVIFNVFYPAMLQVVQAVLRWKRIQLNPLHRYQVSVDICMMTYKVLESMRIKHWAKTLKRNDGDRSRTREISHPPDIKMDTQHKLLYSLEALNDVCTGEETIIFLVQDYEKYCMELSVCGDEITVTISNFMNLCSDYKMYTDGTKKGDSISMEILLNEWLPIWKTCRKTNYVNLTMTNMEVMYNEMSCADLEAMRLNRMMRQKEKGGMIAIDEACEILNDQLKKMTSSVKLGTLLHKSLFVSLMKRCTKVISPDNLYSKSKQTQIGKHVTPTRRRELVAINNLFESVMPFTPMGRKVSDNWLWESYNTNKVEIKPNPDVKLTDHERKVAEVFNTLGSSKTTCALDDMEIDGTISTKNNLSANTQFEENDIFTEEGEHMLLGDHTQDDTTNNDQTMSEAGVEVEVDIDPAVALKSLSNLKKYRINRLCVENLKEKGWTMLGTNLEEERRWAHTVKQRERQQIDEAVLYYCKNQQLCRDRRTKMITMTNKKMKWEIELNRALNDTSYNLML